MNHSTLSSNDNNNNTLDQWVEKCAPVLRHITLHRFIWGMAVILFLLAWNRGLVMLYGLLAVLLAVLFVSHWLVRRNLTDIRVTRSLPDIANAGKPVRIQYHLSTRGKKYLLSLHDGLYGHRIQLFVQSLAGKQSVDINYCYAKRGVYRYTTLHIQSAYPFGLVSKDLFLTLPAHEVLVLPDFFEIKRLSAQTAVGANQGEISSQHLGSQDDVAALREYRRGDPLKTIHWVASARSASYGQDWLVKTFETFDQPKMTIIINQSLTDEAFECMLSIVMSLCRFASQQQLQTVMLGEDKNAIWQHVIHADSAHLLEQAKILARLQPYPDGNYSKCLDIARQSQSESNIVVTFNSPASLLEITHFNIQFGQHGLHGRYGQPAEYPGGEWLGYQRRLLIDPQRHTLQQIAALFQ